VAAAIKKRRELGKRSKGRKGGGEGRLVSSRQVAIVAASLSAI